MLARCRLQQRLLLLFVRHHHQEPLLMPVPLHLQPNVILLFAQAHLHPHMLLIPVLPHLRPDSFLLAHHQSLRLVKTHFTASMRLAALSSLPAQDQTRLYPRTMLVLRRLFRHQWDISFLHVLSSRVSRTDLLVSSWAVYCGSCVCRMSRSFGKTWAVACVESAVSDDFQSRTRV